MAKHDGEGLTDRQESATTVASTDESPHRPSKILDIKNSGEVPGHEALVDDFICAWKRNMIYQGRMYIFDHHLVFDSHIFGRQKSITMPLQEVSSIKKRKFCGFPNAIEVIWRGRDQFFTSFLRRDDAFRVMTYVWEKSSSYSKHSIESGSTATSISHGSLILSDSKRVLGSRHLAKLVDKAHSHSRRGIGTEIGDGLPRSSMDSSASFEGSVEEAATVDVGNSVHSGHGMQSIKEHLSDYHSDSDSDHDSESPDMHDEVEGWQASDEPPPQIEPNMTKLVEAQLDLTVRAFYKEFLSDESQFLISWHESRGDTKVTLSHWRKQQQLGYVRDLTFITPLKQKIGPSKCLCTQTQRTRLHPNEHLIFSTSQIMDIPYGDYFSVNTQWDIVPADGGKACKVTVHLAIPFSKKTMFRSTIEGNTKQLMSTAYEDWIATARKWMEDPIPVQPLTPKSCFEDDAGTPEPLDDNMAEPTHLSRAQSFAIRQSREWHRDKDRPIISHSSYKPDSALQRSNHQSSGGLPKKVSFDLQDASPANDEKSWKKRLLERPVLLLALITLLSLQVLYILWRWTGWSHRSTSHWSEPDPSSFLQENSVHQDLLTLQQRMQEDSLMFRQEMQQVKGLLLDMQHEIIRLHSAFTEA